MNPSLTSKQRRHLKGLAHHLKPVVMIGSKGLTEEVMTKLDDELSHHELIKVKAPEGGAKALGPILEKRGNAALVQVIGRVVVLYRRRKKDPVIELPAR